jgi:hypothetical protein
MSSKIEPTFTAPATNAHETAAQSGLPPAKAPSRWPWLRRLEWLDDISVPHWAPEGDPSCALRAREL